MAKYYAVSSGRKTGVFDNWADCKAQVDGFSGAVYKSFGTYEEAVAFADFKPLEEKDADISRGVHFFTDGSYNPDTKEYGFGYVCLENGKIISVFSDKGDNEELRQHTNVTGELLAAVAALRFAEEEGFKEIAIHHDYEGVGKWADGVWKSNVPIASAYAKKVKALRKKGVKIDFVHVKGHSNNRHNDLADKLAKFWIGLVSEAEAKEIAETARKLLTQEYGEEEMKKIENEMKEDIRQAVKCSTCLYSGQCVGYGYAPYCMAEL